MRSETRSSLMMLCGFTYEYLGTGYIPQVNLQESQGVKFAILSIRRLNAEQPAPAGRLEASIRSADWWVMLIPPHAALFTEGALAHGRFSQKGAPRLCSLALPHTCFSIRCNIRPALQCWFSVELLAINILTSTTHFSRPTTFAVWWQDRYPGMASLKIRILLVLFLYSHAQNILSQPAL